MEMGYNYNKMNVKQLKELLEGIPNDQELPLYLENKGNGWEGMHPTRKDAVHNYFDFIRFDGEFKAFKLFAIGIK